MAPDFVAVSKNDTDQFRKGATDHPRAASGRRPGATRMMMHGDLDHPLPALHEAHHELRGQRRTVARELDPVDRRPPEKLERAIDVADRQAEQKADEQVPCGAVQAPDEPIRTTPAEPDDDVGLSRVDDQIRDLRWIELPLP